MNTHTADATLQDDQDVSRSDVSLHSHTTLTLSTDAKKSRSDAFMLDATSQNVVGNSHDRYDPGGLAHMMAIVPEDPCSVRGPLHL